MNRLIGLHSGSVRVVSPNSVTFLPESSPPSTPTVLAVAQDPTSSSQLLLTWTDNATDETAYSVERSTDGVTYAEIATPAANAVSYTATGLSAATLYYFKVRANRSGTYSAYSNAASATTLFSPTALPSIFAWYDASQDSVVADTTVVTGWTDRSGHARNMTNGTSVDAHFMGPKYRTSVFGSLPALQGWGSLGADRSVLRYNAALPDEATIYLVVKTSTANAPGVMMTSLDGTDPQFTGPYFLLQDNNGTWRTLDNITFRNIMAMTTNTKYIVRITWSKGTLAQQVWVNGVSKLSNIIANSGSNAWYWLFAGYNGVFAGHIAECVITGVLDSGANQTTMESYLNAKWGVY